MIRRFLLATLLLFCGGITAVRLPAGEAPEKNADTETLRVFIFAGQSNMVGSDSKAADIDRFPPFAGLAEPQAAVRFSYCIGREDKLRSNGWVALQPVDGIVGPELSFARRVAGATAAPIAIIKCAAGGTHLGGDWNPDAPSGFRMYPLALDLIRASLAELDAQGIAYRLEGFMWHQGENDMFEEDYMKHYGRNLGNFISCWRRDLGAPGLRFYIGELCTKTIWGMDLRPRMFAISQGQRAVTDKDPLADYVPTAHVGVEIGGGIGLHYHYGTLGQLEHGESHAEAYLRTIGKGPASARKLAEWPYAAGCKVRLFVLAGHRNMEGERAFVQHLRQRDGAAPLLEDNGKIAYRYSIGGGYKVSDDWEPLGPAGFHDTFGPELSFGRALQGGSAGAIAIAKYTHSGSQIIDWTPEGSIATTRNLYPHFLRFVRESIAALEARGHAVDLAGIFYHLGENDMSFAPHRRNAAQWLRSIVVQCRRDLGMPELPWFVSQQPPTDDESVNGIDVTADVAALAAADPNVFHVMASDLPAQEEKLVLDASGVVRLGELLADRYLNPAR